jgi:hypothetical protein
MLRGIFELKREEREARENYVMSSFIINIVYQI